MPKFFERKNTPTCKDCAYVEDVFNFWVRKRPDLRGDQLSQLLKGMPLTFICRRIDKHFNSWKEVSENPKCNHFLKGCRSISVEEQEHFLDRDLQRKNYVASILTSIIIMTFTVVIAFASLRGILF
ncbi:MAG: hypothetical protein ABSB28_05460 [Candidatus Bathyarchaeia archaeon]